MTRAVRVAVLAITGVLALAFAGSALAAYQPRLIAFHQDPRLNDSGGTTLFFATEQTDEATAKLTIYAPAGYQANIAQAPGTQLGSAAARIQARRISPDIILPVEGTIRADSPSNWMSRPTTAACIGAATPQNVWVLVLTASGRQLEVPIFVYAAAGAEAGFASVKLVVCLPPPDVPEEVGGAAFGAKVIEAQLIFNRGVFTTPTSRGLFVWHAYATPWSNFRPPANEAGTMQARALVSLPITITLRVRYDKRRKQAVITGTISATGLDLSGERLQLFLGRRANSLRRNGSTGRISGRGAFSARRALRRGVTFFRVDVVLAGTADQAGCAIQTGAFPAPAGCTATLAVFGGSRAVRVRRP